METLATSMLQCVPACTGIVLCATTATKTGENSFNLGKGKHIKCEFLQSQSATL
jgi:hypothetical protein